MASINAESIAAPAPWAKITVAQGSNVGVLIKVLVIRLPLKQERILAS